MGAFEGFLLRLFPPSVLMVAATASAAGKVHFNHCSSLLPPLPPLFKFGEPGQGANHASLGAGRGPVRKGNLSPQVRTCAACCCSLKVCSPFLAAAVPSKEDGNPDASPY